MDSSLPQKKILIVEDDFFIRDLYETDAKNSGFQVITAVDGEDAIAKTKVETPDLFLVDLMLPKLDGISLIKNLKADPRFSKTPFIVITNLEDPSKVEAAKQAGAAEYILKINTTPARLIENLKKYL